MSGDVHATERYIREKLWVAVDALATGTQPLQKRLWNAYTSALSRLRPDDFADPHARATFTTIIDTLTSGEALGEEGSVAATTAQMSDDQAQRVAEQIISLDTHFRPR